MVLEVTMDAIFTPTSSFSIFMLSLCHKSELRADEKYWHHSEKVWDGTDRKVLQLSLTAKRQTEPLFAQYTR